MRMESEHAQVQQARTACVEASSDEEHYGCPSEDEGQSQAGAAQESARRARLVKLRGARHESRTISEQIARAAADSSRAAPAQSAWPVDEARVFRRRTMPTRPPPGQGVREKQSELMRLREPTSHMRVFVHSLQQYVVVPLYEGTLAWHVLQYVQAHHALPTHRDASTAYAVHDVIPGAGLERPVREYERIDDVVRARGADGYFVVKDLDWIELVRAEARPTVSGVLGGYVYVCSGDERAWTQWWLELREHAIYLTTSPTSESAGRVCTMLDVDIYTVDARRVALPEALAFALRAQSGTGQVVLMAAQSDAAAHSDWIKNIFRARSYVLCQERPDLLANARTLEKAEQRAASDRRVRSIQHQAALQRSKSMRHKSGPADAPLIPEASLDVPFKKGSLLDTVQKRAARPT